MVYTTGVLGMFIGRNGSELTLKQRFKTCAAWLDGFNPKQIPHHAYNNLIDFEDLCQFWMHMPMFIHLQWGEWKPPPLSHLYPQVLKAKKQAYNPLIDK